MVITVNDGDYSVDEGQTNVQGWSNILAISAGGNHTVALTPYGNVLYKGYSWYGGSDVDEWEDIVAVSAGRCHTVGLTKDGTVVVSGYNANGQCDVEYWSNIKLPK